MAAIETDYLVIGTGGSAMAFVDTLLTEAPEARIVMVDRHHRPGGQWNDAYSFVRLHQPAAWYGVASYELSDWHRETSGFNTGMWSLASGPEVLSHFEHVMKHRFLSSGRVQWLPKCEWLGAEDGVHCVRSLMAGEAHAVKVRRKLVNATHARIEVPSTHPPKYTVTPGVTCIPLNGLPTVTRAYANYTVVGAGKTGMDACIWLVENGVPHERIRWVVPRDPWMMDRANLQPGPDGWRRNFAFSLAQFDAMCDATDLADLFHRLEESGALMRIDPEVKPTTYRCAVVSRGELAQLRRIGEAGGIVRLGRVRSIEPSRMVLDRGERASDPDTLYIDCSASAIQPLPDVPIFEPTAINLLMVRFCQPLMSASVIAWVEAHVTDTAGQNALCRPVRGPERPADYVYMWVETLANAARWRQNPELMGWLSKCRLNAQAVILRGVEVTPEVKDKVGAIAARAAQATARSPELLAMAAASAD
ncbi:MAG: hypothetical protein J7605_21050 [Variovorax sp.]|nr:hypothetical protein [Variovorax sp.]